MYCLTTEGKEVWRFRCGEAMDCGIGYEGMFFFCNGDGFFYAVNAKSGKELWRYRTGSVNYHLPTLWNGKLYFSSWDCHVYAITLEGKEVWRFTSSNTQESKLPPVYEAWKTEVKKTSTIEDSIPEDKYKSKKEQSVSLSDYHVTSEYTTTSEYKQKSDYDTSFVIFEEVMENIDILEFGNEKLRFQTICQQQV